jgi:hypothetical protein
MRELGDILVTDVELVHVYYQITFLDGCSHGRIQRVYFTSLRHIVSV